MSLEGLESVIRSRLLGAQCSSGQETTKFNAEESFSLSSIGGEHMRKSSLNGTLMFWKQHPKTQPNNTNYLEQQKHAGLILKYWFERFTWKIASNRCSYTPDFLVMRPDKTLELHEVKGSLKIFADDAKVKCKVCADECPIPLFIVTPKTKKEGGGWNVEAY